jgi:hypothetical protein
MVTPPNRVLIKQVRDVPLSMKPLTLFEYAGGELLLGLIMLFFLLGLGEPLEDCLALGAGLVDPGPVGQFFRYFLLALEAEGLEVGLAGLLVVLLLQPELAAGLDSLLGGGGGGNLATDVVLDLAEDGAEFIHPLDYYMQIL